MKLELTADQVASLRQGFTITISRPVEVPDSIQARLNLLATYPVKHRGYLNGVCEGDSIALVVGAIKLNIDKSCVEFDVYDQQEVA